MVAFLFILRDIIMPVFIIIILGYILQKRFNLDVQTLARLNIYLLVPAFIFAKLSTTDIAMQLFLQVIFFASVYIFVLYIISSILGHFLKLGAGKKTTFTNSIIFFNSGNYGIPVNDLVFRSDPVAMSIQVLMMVYQNILLFSFGIFTMQSVSMSKLRALLAYFKMPVLYAMLAGVCVNVFNIPMPSMIMVPADYIANALIAIALITLGGQVAQLELTAGLKLVYISVAMRLLAGPAIALVIIYAFQLDGMVAQALFIASAVPTSVNSAIIAQEYKMNPDMAAQIVLFSTIASAFTVSLVIFVSHLLFG